MGEGSNVVHLPVPGDKVTCHLTIPRFDYILELEEDAPSGLLASGFEMERVAGQFASLAHVFERCPEATYTPRMLFINGHLTFEFQVPRHWLKRLREFGWDPDDLDVGSEGTVSSESDFPDA